MQPIVSQEILGSLNLLLYAAFPSRCTNLSDKRSYNVAYFLPMCFFPMKCDRPYQKYLNMVF